MCLCKNAFLVIIICILLFFLTSLFISCVHSNFIFLVDKLIVRLDAFLRYLFCGLHMTVEVIGKSVANFSALMFFESYNRFSRKK